MPIPLLPIIGAALAGAVAGASFTRLMDGQSVHRYDEDGYNSYGFDKDGYDRSGYDAAGYDRDGFDRDGFDRSGFNHDGFDRAGYDRAGIDAAGRNRKGFDRAGWNEQGKDITGHDAAFYADNVAEIKERLSKAEEFMSAGDYEHASLEIRIGAEQAVKCVVSHTLGVGRYRRHFETDIDSCKGALSDDLIGKLHMLRQTCRAQLHIDVRDVKDLQIDAKYVDNLEGKLGFCMKTLEEVLVVVEGYASGA